MSDSKLPKYLFMSCNIKILTTIQNFLLRGQLEVIFVYERQNLFRALRLCILYAQTAILIPCN